MANLRFRRAKATEKAACAVLGKKHLGGPGEPDCRGGGQVVEVKDLKRKLSKYDMKVILKKPWAKRRERVVASKSGFTPGAKELAADRGRTYLYKIQSSGRRRSSRRVYPRR
jgi:hypothetical protein